MGKRPDDAKAVLDRIIDADAATDDAAFVDADARGLAELADHIEATHHAYLGEELPRRREDGPPVRAAGELASFVIHTEASDWLPATGDSE